MFTTEARRATAGPQLLEGRAQTVRRIDGDDAPWPGLVVRLDSGDPALIVSCAVLGRDWAGWRLHAPQHVIAPTDVRRSKGGHEAVFPLCAERVTTFVARRSAGSAPLSDGEAITLAISLLRGISELADVGLAEKGHGSWWLTDEGRPGFALHERGDRAADVAADILHSLRVGDAVAAELRRTASAITGEEVDRRRLRDLEERLFDRAEPEPLATASFDPRPAAPLRSLSAIEPGTHNAAAAVAAEAASRRDGLLIRLLRHADVDMAGTLAAAFDRVRERLRRARPRRASSVMLAGAAATGVLAVGLLWPAAADEGDPGSAPHSSTPVPAPTATTAPEAPRRTADTDDPAVAAAALLDARIACGEDQGCLASVVWSAPSAFTGGAIDLPAAEREHVLLDDFGGVAVVRVSSPSGRAADQLVVVARRDDSWLLRDVHDVAQQP